MRKKAFIKNYFSKKKNKEIQKKGSGKGISEENRHYLKAMKIIDKYFLN